MLENVLTGAVNSIVVVVAEVIVKLPVKAPPVAKLDAPEIDSTAPTGGAHAFGDPGTPEVIAVMVAVATPLEKVIPLMTTVTGA